VSTKTKSKTFLQECVSIPAYSALEGHGPEWGYRQVERGLPVVELPTKRLIHLPTADEYHRSKLRSRGRKLKAK
jgi:hypothetical protein